MEAYYQSPIGVIKIIGSKKGISEVIFTDILQVEDSKVPKELESCLFQLDEYFNHNRTMFDLQLDVIGTEFQRMVWDSLLQIPYGKTLTYSDIANKVGGSDVVRAAANAIGKNKLNIIIPCHRVIGINGNLTGYAGGLKRKEWLLNFENKVKQGNLFYNTNYKLYNCKQQEYE